MFELLFGYPLEIYEKAHWVFDSAWPLSYLFIVLIISGCLVSFFLVRANSALSVFRKISIGFVQCLTIIILLILLWQPTLVVERLKLNQNSIAIMLDTSQSMAYGSDSGVRVDQARELIASPSIRRIEEAYPIDNFVFSDDTTPVADFQDLPNPGTQTNIGSSLLEVLERAKSKSLAAVVLFSDGAESGSVLSTDQMSEISAYGVPVHTVGIGREKISEDVELERLIVQERALPDTLVSAEVSIRHDAAGLTRLKVYQGDDFLAMTEVELSGVTGSTAVQIEFDAGKPGFKELSFQLDPIDGERNLANNRRSHVLEVADQEYRILYVEGEPRWEYKYIRRALASDPTTQLMTLLWVSNNKFYRQGIEDVTQLETGFPEDKKTLYEYDALVIGSIEAPRFTSDQQQLIRDFVNDRGGSLLMLGGQKGLADGGWGNTPVGDILPVRLKDVAASYVKERARVVVTPQGAASEFLKFDELADTNAERWRQLPPLDNYQMLGSLRPAAAALMNLQANDKQLPLLVRQPYGNGQSYVFATGGTWRWQMNMPSEDDSHETFWRQLFRNLVLNSAERMSFRVESDDEEFRLVADVKDDNFEPLSDVRVLAVMSTDSPDEQGGFDNAAGGIELMLSPETAGRYEGRLKTSQTGTHYIDAIASRGDQPIDAVRVAIHRTDTGSESFGIRQDRTQLEQIASATGGQYWTADNFEGLPQAVEGSRAGVVEQVRYPLWGIPAAFLLLILVKLIEWLLRRRWGQI